MSVLTAILKKRPPTWLLAILTLLPLAVLLILRNHLSPHSSDDVAVQVAVDGWLRGLHHTTFLPSDNYLFKLPIYLAVELLPFTPHVRLLTQVLILNLVSFAAFIVALYWLMAPGRSKPGDRAAVLVPTLWLTLIGGAFGLDMMVANYRNLELGLAFLVVALVYRYVGSSIKCRSPWLAAAILVLSCFWFSDPYFLLLVCLPLIGFMWGWYVLRERSRRLLVCSLLLMASAALSYMWKPVVSWLGIEIGGGASLSLADIPHNLALLWPSLCSLMNLHVGSHARALVSVLTIDVMAAGAIAALVNLWTGWRERRFMWFFLGAQWLVIIAAFALSSYVYDIGAGRYLVLIPFYLALNLALVLNRLPHGVVRTGLLVLLSASILANATSDFRELTNPKLYPGTASQGHTLKVLEAAGATKGYAQYWSANINTYLDGSHPTVVPIDCAVGQIKPLYWFTDDALLRHSANRTFYLYEDNVPQAAACPLPSLENQFGAPARTVQIDAHATLLIYNYDISQRFVEVHTSR